VSAGQGESGLLLAALADYVPAGDPGAPDEYARGRAEMWAEWAEGLGIPNQP